CSEFVMGWLLPLTVLALIVVIGAVLYRPYQRSPEKQWRDRVLRLGADAQRHLHAELHLLRTELSKRKAEAQTLHDRAFVAYLNRIPVEQLDEYPGIGPVTIGKLRQAGYTTLALLRNAHIDVAGLGDKRLADIRAAVADLTIKVQETFATGACPEAHELAHQLLALEGQHDERALRAKARVTRLEAFLKQIERVEAVARHVTWRNYWQARGSPLVPSDLMRAALPDLPATLAAADADSKIDQRATNFLEKEAPAGIPLSQPARPVAEPSRAERLAVLEIDAALPVAADLVRRQYNLLWERYDPEKGRAMGPGLVALAENKRAAVAAAARALMTEWGEPLEIEAQETTPSGLRDNPDLDAVFGV